MRFAAAILLSTAVLVQPLLAAPAQAQDAAAADGATQSATRAAEDWLALVDAADYAGSWKQGAAVFRGAVTQEQWSAALRGARGPLGALKLRKLARTQFTRRLPGAPDGEYVVIQYQTEFAGRSALETVVPMREADGSWRVSGYVVQ